MSTRHAPPVHHTAHGLADQRLHLHRRAWDFCRTWAGSALWPAVTAGLVPYPHRDPAGWLFWYESEIAYARRRYVARFAKAVARGEVR